MKKWLFLCMAAVLLAGCATTYYDSEGNVVPKEKMAQLKAVAVKSHLQERRFRVFVDRVYPMRGPSHTLRDDWGMELSGDSIGLFLPYFGRVYQVPYGRGLGLNFVEPLTSYREEAVKDGVRITMTTRSGIESYQITLLVYDNAAIDLTIIPGNKEMIRFTGEMELNDRFSPKR